jgi:RNA polymerase sigma-70 factor, ECF subfamily
MEDLDFQKIHASYRQKIYRYLARLVGDFEAEDLTQDVFVRVNQALPSFRAESRLSTWVYRIATNAALDRLRQPSFQRAARAQSLDELAPDESEVEVAEKDLWTGAAVPSLEQQIHHLERLDCFCGVINDLPDTYRAVILLDQVEDFTAKEIAEILGLNITQVKMRLHRGRERLFQELRKHCKPEDWL